MVYNNNCKAEQKINHSEELEAMFENKLLKSLLEQESQLVEEHVVDEINSGIMEEAFTKTDVKYWNENTITTFIEDVKEYHEL